ncbi:MAG: acyltransferase [Microthrixaceae bacterium]|nr:acyltransferase [Microthrixaceae bacterium]MCO5313109.1 acyltransferase [Microthrixaceae bacterium]HPB44415.1 acyltransferase [Microthrixaceae bacterium]
MVVSNTAQVHDDGAALPRITSLDGVRGVAILLTLVFHSFDSRLSWAVFGERGVDLFFVLSGFLITGILIETRDHPRYFRNFIARRAVRIFPLYYLFLVLMLFVAPVIVNHLPSFVTVPEEFFELQNGPDGLWTVWVYLQNFVLGRGPHQLPGLGHLWSLAVEEQFYLFWPVVMYFVPAPSRLRWFCIGILGSMTLRTALLWGGVINTYGAREYTFNRLDTLLIGACGALYLRDPKAREFIGTILGWVARPIVMAPILLIGLMPIWTVSDVFPNFAYGPGLTLLALVFLLYVVRAAQGQLGPRVERATNWPFNLVLGKYSYAMYLFHFPIAHTMQSTMSKLGDRLGPIGQLVGSAVSFGVTLGASLLIARITWVLWEEPWLRFKKRFAYRPIET